MIKRAQNIEFKSRQAIKGYSIRQHINLAPHSLSGPNES